MIEARALVPGDLIQVTEGDRVPADARLTDGAIITLDESIVTGESVPVQRDPKLGGEIFGGTLMTSGHAIAEITATGARSQVGRIGAALDVVPPRAPVQREVDHIVPRLAVVAGVLVLGLVVLRGATDGQWLQAVLSGITLAMTLLPEELPVVLAVFFALGAWRIAKRGVLARRSAAVETLGAMTVLCVDKTGTLTKNQMAIARLVTDELELEIGDVGELPEAAHELVEFGHLACPSHATDPMDKAFATLVARELASTEHVHPRWVAQREYPLQAELLAVTHLWQDGGKQIVATKGAPEAIIDLCHLPPDAAERWRARASDMATHGLRVLGVARGTFDGAELPASPHDFDFTIVGLVGLADPVRPETAELVARCRAAGIRVVMITGDHLETARAIAATAGLADGAITGAEIESQGEAELVRRLRDVHVIARAVPAHKLRIVSALHACGEVVGMTGDGVNDAPALAAADVGIAMGARGSDVAREAAGLVLVDDNLRSIVDAVEIGRTIFDNLRTSVGYLIAVHLPIAAIALIPPMLGWGALVTPLQIVFLELVIDPTCSIVFELEPPAVDVLRRPPRRTDVRLFELTHVLRSALYGLVGLVGMLVVVALGRRAALPVEQIRALAFVGLVVGNVAILAALRTRPLRANPTAAVAIALVAGLLALVVEVPWFAARFNLTPPPWGWTVVVIAVTVIPVVALGWARDLRARGGATPVMRESPLVLH
ncbi:MAG: cation-translocating P-type ATPase [Proteobacteria bacterium]|nr:cation-translocating P-type ATPase [Pseudomonadota bacterium]